MCIIIACSVHCYVSSMRGRRDRVTRVRWLILSCRLQQHCSLRRCDWIRGRGRDLFFTIISAIFERSGLRISARGSCTGGARRTLSSIGHSVLRKRGCCRLLQLNDGWSDRHQTFVSGGGGRALRAAHVGESTGLTDNDGG
jgi:hypothetical protein